MPLHSAFISSVACVRLRRWLPALDALPAHRAAALKALAHVRELPVQQTPPADRVPARARQLHEARARNRRLLLQADRAFPAFRVAVRDLRLWLRLGLALVLRPLRHLLCCDRAARARARLLLPLALLLLSPLRHLRGSARRHGLTGRGGTRGGRGRDAGIRTARGGACASWMVSPSRCELTTAGSGALD